MDRYRGTSMFETQVITQGIRVGGRSLTEVLLKYGKKNLPKFR